MGKAGPRPTFFIVEKALLGEIRQRISPLLTGQGIELVDLLLARERGRPVLRFLVDKPEGITLDECTRLNRRISEVLDREDTLQQSYVLEVSSPGLDRPLKSSRDFARYLGKPVRVVLHEPLNKQNVFEGPIDEVAEESIVLQAKGKEKVRISRSNIARANPEVQL